MLLYTFLPPFHQNDFNWYTFPWNQTKVWNIWAHILKTGYLTCHLTKFEASGFPPPSLSLFGGKAVIFQMHIPQNCMERCSHFLVRWRDILSIRLLKTSSKDIHADLYVWCDLEDVAFVHSGLNQLRFENNKAFVHAKFAESCHSVDNILQMAHRLVQLSIPLYLTLCQNNNVVSDLNVHKRLKSFENI